MMNKKNAKVAIMGIIAATAIYGCGKKEISDSNTNSVKNSPFTETQETAQAALSSMEEIKTAVRDILGDSYWPDHQLTKEELLEKTGITPEMYEEYLAEDMNIETDIDTMIILRVNKEKLSNAEIALNAYREKLMAEFEGRPQEYGKAAASRIEIIDQYICFVQLGAGASTISKTDADKVLAVCQQENERAVDAIEKAILE